MDVVSAIKKRRSIRNYSDKAVEDSKIQLLLELASQAPSVSNRQEWRFVVVRAKEARLALSQAAKNQKFVGEAPVVIVACADTDKHIMTCGQLCYPIDVAIAIDHMTLVAVELGLGTCWIGAFHEEQVKEVLNIPTHIRVVEMLAVGYPSEYPQQPKSRFSLGKIAFYESWGKT